MSITILNATRKKISHNEGFDNTVVTFTSDKDIKKYTFDIDGEIIKEDSRIVSDQAKLTIEDMSNKTVKDIRHIDSNTEIKQSIKGTDLIKEGKNEINISEIEN